MINKPRKIGVIVAARTGSTRLPGKALMKIGELPMIALLFERLKSSEHADKLILATTTLEADNELSSLISGLGFDVFRGSSADVVSRYVDATNIYNFDYVIRVTGDCPFVSGELIDYCLDFVANIPDFDVASTKGHFPVGIDCEIYSAKAMQYINSFCDPDAEEREHLTLYFYRNPSLFKIIPILPNECWLSTASCTVDTEEDMVNANVIYNHFNRNDFSLEELVNKLNEKNVLKTI